MAKSVLPLPLAPQRMTDLLKSSFADLPTCQRREACLDAVAELEVGCTPLAGCSAPWPCTPGWTRPRQPSDRAHGRSPVAPPTQWHIQLLEWLGVLLHRVVDAVDAALLRLAGHDRAMQTTATVGHIHMEVLILVWVANALLFVTLAADAVLGQVAFGKEHRQNALVVQLATVEAR
eukprot:4406055-Prymnesium_polylepis.1